ncbi:hypothetical protein F4677DRAFT_431417 [Hypoxylon crocopeplum]|nr:hypothetical protein F4677DRAFT_431417 [Hypoxylon crocopeplum]
MDPIIETPGTELRGADQSPEHGESTFVASPSAANEITVLLRAIKGLTERQETLINLMEHSMIPRPKDKSVPVGDSTDEDLLNLDGMSENDLDVAREYAQNLRRSIEWEWNYGQDDEARLQNLNALKGFLTAFAIPGLGYYQHPLDQIDVFTHNIPKPSANLRNLCSAILQWGIYKGSPDRAKSELSSTTVRDRWIHETTTPKLPHVSLAPNDERYMSSWQQYEPVYSIARHNHRTNVNIINGLPEERSTGLTEGLLDPEKCYFARTWSVCVRSRISMKVLAMLLCKLSGPRIQLRNWTGSTAEGNNTDYQFSRGLAKGAVAFILAFTGPWSESAGLISPQISDSAYYHIQHHMRVLQFAKPTDLESQGYEVPQDRSSKEKSNKTTKDSGSISCTRVIGPFERLDRTTMHIKEARLSAAAITFTRWPLPIFSISRLSDSISRLDSHWDPRFKPEDWTAGMKFGRYFKGIATFQLALYRIMNEWAGYWSSFLSELDSTVQIKLENILNQEERKKLMLDDAELKKSDRYFGVLQLLRIMTHWVEQSKEGIEKLPKDWDERHSGLYFDIRGLHIPCDRRKIELDASVISKNWEILVHRHKTLAEGLLKEIGRRTEDIKTLRDGLFNATSVGEATRSGELSRYIYIFTIATVFYLPISFVCTFYGMHLFDSGDTGTNQISFAVSIVAISIGTYILLFGFWLNDKRRHRGLEWTRKKADKEAPSTAPKQPIIYGDDTEFLDYVHQQVALRVQSFSRTQG